MSCTCTSYSTTRVSPGNTKWRRRESNPHQGGSKTLSRPRCYRLTPCSHTGSFPRSVPSRPVSSRSIPRWRVTLGAHGIPGPQLRPVEPSRGEARLLGPLERARTAAPQPLPSTSRHQRGDQLRQELDQPLHGQEGPAMVCQAVSDIGDDAGVAQLSQDGGLAGEALEGLGVVDMEQLESHLAWRAEGARGAGRCRVLSMRQGLSDLSLPRTLTSQLQGASILGHLEQEALAGCLVRDVLGAAAHATQCLAQGRLTCLGVSLGQACLC
jgi:hypothetical protein